MSWARLYRYRVQIEEALRMELMELDRAVQKVNEVRAQWQRISDDGATGLMMDTGQGLEAGIVQDRLSEWHAVQTAMANINRAVAVAGDRRDRKQTELMEAVRDRRTMELLIKRAAERKQRAQRRQEQLVQDDLATHRWARGVS